MRHCACGASGASKSVSRVNIYAVSTLDHRHALDHIYALDSQCSVNKYNYVFKSVCHHNFNTVLIQSNNITNTLIQSTSLRLLLLLLIIIINLKIMVNTHKESLINYYYQPTTITTSTIMKLSHKQTVKERGKTLQPFCCIILLFSD